MVFADQRRVVDVREETHEESVTARGMQVSIRSQRSPARPPTLHSLAIKSIRQSTVSRNRVAKVFDVEGSLEARGKEAAEWSDERGKGCHDERV